MNRTRALVATTLVAAVFCSACNRPPDADPRVVSAWAHTLYGVLRVERLSPPVSSRLSAYATTALYAGMTAGTAKQATIKAVFNDPPDLPRADNAREYDPIL